MSLILGINILGQFTSSSIFVDGKIKHAISEERLTRQKGKTDFPIMSIKHCLKSLGLNDLSSIDEIIVNWNPEKSMKLINRSGFTKYRRYDPEYLFIIPNNLSDFYGNKKIEQMSQTFSDGKIIRYLNHHLSHFGWVYSSKFEKCCVAIFDEYGEDESVSFYDVNGNNYKKLKNSLFPNSLGIFFSTFTEFLGMKPYNDEWKIMGAAAYGDNKRFLKKIEEIVYVDKEGLFLDKNFFTYSDTRFSGYYNHKLKNHLNINLEKNDYKSQDFFDLAASVQAVFEKILIQLLRYLYKITKKKKLVINGGTAMNCLANGKIVSQTDFQDIYVSFAPGDLGSSIGAVLFNIASKSKKIFRCDIPPYLGPSFTKSEVKNYLRSNKIKFSESKNYHKVIATLISQGHLVGWFFDRMEFGERALGNRSILADPRKPETLEKINKTVKFRESFRPLAPAVKEECAESIFILENQKNLYFMDRTVKVRKKWLKKIPSVTHKDQSSRIQMVSKKTNKNLWTLLDEFELLTDTPVLVNTSFNINGEPIVCTPKDAINTFFNSSLEVLCIEGFLIYKNLDF